MSCCTYLRARARVTRRARRSGRESGAAALEFALEKGWLLPPYPTERGIPLEEVQRYLTDLQSEMPYKPALYDTRVQALAEARRALAEGQRLEDLVILEWDEGARELRRLPVLPAPPR